MLVSFLDDEGNMYDWAPKWTDVDEIYKKQTNIERFNKPESEWLNKFAKTSQEIVEGAQRIESAYKVEGFFERYQGQKLLIKGTNVYEELTPGFEVTISFLDSWLGNNVEALIINDMVIRLTMPEFDDFNNFVRVREYPEPKEGELEPEDLPFD
jgi:hypothetical protein